MFLVAILKISLKLRFCVWHQKSIRFEMGPKKFIKITQKWARKVLNITKESSEYYSMLSLLLHN